MKTKISPIQFFILIFLVPYGSASLFLLVPDAKQDGWIAILIYILAGIVLQFIYTQLFYLYTSDTLIKYLKKIFGRFIGSFFAFLYILYFIYLASRVLRDFAELILIFISPKMPLITALVVLMASIAYGAYTGIENLGRAAQISIMLTIAFFVLQLLLLFLTPDLIKIENLMPVMEEGLINIMKSGVGLIFFPYGETIVFTMLYSSVTIPQKVRRLSFIAIIVEGVVLAIYNIIYIVTLGVNYASASAFPMLNNLMLIDVGFFSRLDILIVIAMLIGGFFKISVLMYAAMLGTSDLFNMKKPDNLAIPYGILIIIISFLIAKNYPQHLQIGFEFTPVFVHLPIQVIIPTFTLLVHYIKKLWQK